MIYLDTETYNAEKDISAGTYEYTRTCEAMLVSYAFDDGPVHLWDCTGTSEMPADLREALEDAGHSIIAHNAMFDRNVIRYALGVYTKRSRWRCTMVKAMAHGLPGSLDQIGVILGLPSDKAKLKAGKKHIQRFCKPAPKNHKADRYTKETHPEEWAGFCEYAAADITAMREIDKRLPNWNMKESELALYHLDQKINDRGFAVDTDLVEAGSRAAATEKINLAKRFVELTEGAVQRPTMREQFRVYLNDRFDLSLDNTRAQTFRDLLKADNALPEDLRELMQISIRSNKTSTAKYKTLAPAVSPDGRFRGGLQYAGAARTRRWSGRTFQPQNLPSRGLPDAVSVDCYIRALKADMHEDLFDNLMLYGSAALRGVVVAPENKKLVVSDLSNIEGRANAWLAGETWKLEAFRAFDRGDGPDLYKVAAGRILGKDPLKVNKPERNGLGKVSELAFGYQGGVGACQNFAKDQMADLMPIIQASAGQFVARAKDNWVIWGEERNEGSDTSYDEWIASESVKLAWRDRHPAICSLWKACEEAARLALKNRGRVYRAGPKLRFKTLQFAGHTYLLMKLPSGKFCCYFEPRLTRDGTLTYMRVNPLTKQWERSASYGGVFVENACQSLSRDILCEGMLRAEDRNYEIILTVHDELVTETPDTAEFNAPALSSLLATVPDFAEGFPLAAAGFEAARYRKD